MLSSDLLGPAGCRAPARPAGYMFCCRFLFTFKNSFTPIIRKTTGPIFAKFAGLVDVAVDDQTEISF